MEEKEEWKGFEDQSSSDPVHARVREAHPDVREEISLGTEINLPDRIPFVKEYLANLQETYSVTTERTDSGLSSRSAHSESGLYDDTGNCSVISCYLLSRMNTWKVGAHDMGNCLRGIDGAVNKYGHSEMIYASTTLISKARIVLDVIAKEDCPP